MIQQTSEAQALLAGTTVQRVLNVRSVSFNKRREDKMSEAKATQAKPSKTTPAKQHDGARAKAFGRETMDSTTTVGKPMGRLLSISGGTLGRIIIGDYFPVVVSHPWVLPLLCGGRS